MRMHQTADPLPIIHVYLITFRRPLLFKRALASILAQSYSNILVRIINDDPDDTQVLETICEVNDPRVAIYAPSRKRGGTANFNIAFTDTAAPFVTVLEDDNWWEPDFLQLMYQTLLEYPNARAAVCNELIWKEMGDGSWLNTGHLIWDDRGDHLHEFSLEDIATHSRFLNSATLLRTDAALHFGTPETIPVDLTESFRELMFDKPIVVVGKPLVNFALTIQTARSDLAHRIFACLMVGSIFISLDRLREQKAFAKRLWNLCSSSISPRAMTLVMTGIYFREARPLLTLSPISAKARFMLWSVRHGLQFLAMLRMRHRYEHELRFLLQAPLMRRLVERAWKR